MIPFVERFEIINAIKGVSKAVRVDTLDKEEIWKNMPYHLLMIGSDWKGNERWLHTEKTMLTHGVKVIYLPYTYDTTSTLIREKLLHF